jgi:hypothetical protein
MRPAVIGWRRPLDSIRQPITRKLKNRHREYLAMVRIADKHRPNPLLQQLLELA